MGYRRIGRDAFFCCDYCLNEIYSNAIPVGKKRNSWYERPEAAEIMRASSFSQKQYVEHLRICPNAPLRKNTNEQVSINETMPTIKMKSAEQARKDWLIEHGYYSKSVEEEEDSTSHQSGTSINRTKQKKKKAKVKKQ
jgi:hypothetical protein